MAKGPNIPASLHSGDKEAVGYLMAQEKAAKDNATASEANATDITSLTARIAALESATIETFVSSDQTISALGVLTLPHGFTGDTSKIKIWAFIVCQTTEAGWPVGAVIPVSTTAGTFTVGASGAETMTGGTITSDATNLTVTFAEGFSAGVQYVIAHKTTGVASGASNTNWLLRVMATL